jgi:hypothetical protein
MKAEARNPKSEISDRLRPMRDGHSTLAFGFRSSDFGLLSAFDLRPSGFPLWNVS